MFSRVRKFLDTKQLLIAARRFENHGAPTQPSGEDKLKTILQKSFPNAKVIEVVDISGGCGAMYDITVLAPELKGLSIVKQHRMINEVLKEEIKDMHGLRINTSAP
ncbi:bolA-like protein 3 [Thrips palmi]|uniref:BolA-like protein 3 n=1 Tax=Thrips palmi TaxID=161013 RepID=A0A6P8YJY9_THRPL|nr:bolA-like protein 3 [Thrips palmi]